MLRERRWGGECCRSSDSELEWGNVSVPILDYIKRKDWRGGRRLTGVTTRRDTTHCAG